MGGRTIRRAALVLAAFAWAAPAPAQPPDEPGMLPPLELPFEDAAVEPAQFRQTVGPAAGPANREPPPVGRAVADPPPPVVRIQVRVPADAPQGEDVKYVLHVQNTSSADAHGVTVRNPLQDGAAFVRAEPKPDDKQSTAQQLVWAVGTLKAGQSKTIELVLKPKADAKEVRNIAYVRFEHGEAVTTRLTRPGVKVTKAAPKDAVRDEPFAVRVVVENTGRVPAEGVRVVETVPAGAEVEAVTAGGRKTKDPAGNQWEWEVGTVMPGRRQVIEYRLTPKQAGEALTTTAVEATKGDHGKAEAATRVLVPGLGLKLAGPSGPVGPGEKADYVITVRNTGTLTAANVRVTGAVPPGCRLRRKSEGGQASRDAVSWVLPRLAAGEAWELTYTLEAVTSGRRVVGATATDSRRQTAGQEVATVFEGTAALVWEQVFDPSAPLPVGRPGVLTVRVRNNGGEPARNARVTVELPAGVSLVEATPRAEAPGGKLAFPAETVPAGGQREYTLTFRADRSGEAVFRMTLAADALGSRPVEASKSVTVTGGK
ncbi:MAG: DUF11 domain-containing protein [Gemmataceae bacterium]|nr:DUF11 domain-containing protein [Gemmataceae bacterium]